MSKLRSIIAYNKCALFIAFNVTHNNRIKQSEWIGLQLMNYVYHLYMGDNLVTRVTSFNNISVNNNVVVS